MKKAKADAGTGLTTTLELKTLSQIAAEQWPVKEIEMDNLIALGKNKPLYEAINEVARQAVSLRVQVTETFKKERLSRNQQIQQSRADDVSKILWRFFGGESYKVHKAVVQIAKENPGGPDYVALFIEAFRNQMKGQ